ncbi:MAG TPA: histidine kinase dimerization/phospho-acceptor domain-containing protein, partial [Pusillimonas sp.]
MDGFKERLNASVQLKLFFVLFLAVSVVAIAAGAFSFISAFVGAHELQDDVLYQIAALATRQDIPTAVSQNGVSLDDNDNDSTIFVQYLGGKGRHNALALPGDLSEGLHTLGVNGKTYRVLIKATQSGRKIAIAQLTEDRNDMAYDSAMRTLTPFFILVPVLLIILISLIRKMFRPITELAAQIDERSEQDLRPMPSHGLPTEVRPFVRALNRLLERVAESINTQRRFVADAAHELRSPLTALSLQAERLDQAEMSDEARSRLKVVQQGIERGRNLLNQLLSLSKAQSAEKQAESAVSVKTAFRQVLEDLIPQANAKGIDVGVLEGPDAIVRA